MVSNIYTHGWTDIPELHILGSTLNSVELTEEEISLADCVVITTDYSYYWYIQVNATKRGNIMS